MSRARAGGSAQSDQPRLAVIRAGRSRTAGLEHTAGRQRNARLSRTESSITVTDTQGTETGDKRPDGKAVAP